MDNTNAQVPHLQKVAYKHDARVGHVYGSSDAECVMGCSEVANIGVTSTQAKR